MKVEGKLFDFLTVRLFDCSTKFLTHEKSATNPTGDIYHDKYDALAYHVWFFYRAKIV